jgi:hypothetical protein
MKSRSQLGFDWGWSNVINIEKTLRKKINLIVIREYLMRSPVAATHPLPARTLSGFLPPVFHAGFVGEGHLGVVPVCMNPETGAQ